MNNAIVDKQAKVIDLNTISITCFILLKINKERGVIKNPFASNGNNSKLLKCKFFNT